MRPTIYLLWGHPGTGKLTVAREMVLQMDAAKTRIVDNQYANPPIFSLVDVDGQTPLSSEIWDRIAEVRDAIVRTIETLSPLDWSFIFTNHLVNDDDDRAWVKRLQKLAAMRQSEFVPVRMDCSLEQLLKRITRPDRIERMKLIDDDWMRVNYDPERLLDIEHPNLIRVDTTDEIPTEVARRIIS